jgi:hypothetical protein
MAVAMVMAAASTGAPGGGAGGSVVDHNVNHVGKRHGASFSVTVCEDDLREGLLSNSLNF